MAPMHDVAHTFVAFIELHLKYLVDSLLWVLRYSPSFLLVQMIGVIIIHQVAGDGVRNDSRR